MNKRLLIERQEDFRYNKGAAHDLRGLLHIPNLYNLRRVNVYDLFDCPEDLLDLAVSHVFSDPVTDQVLEALPECKHLIVCELLPGQFDQRADSAEQCLRALDARFEKTRVLCARAWLIMDELEREDYLRLKNYLVNPLECREKNMNVMQLPQVKRVNKVEIYKRFNELSAAELQDFHQHQSLAMSMADLNMVQLHFQSINRPPTETEIRLLDTYWSDHCRHTTFATSLPEPEWPSSAFGQLLDEEFKRFQRTRAYLYQEEVPDRAFSLMDLATINAKKMKAAGELQDVEFSAEINACSVKVEVEEEGQKAETWLLQFKNETHNHPTEIEPFGGAATCVGGAIRDPLSGRAYVYQSMRISGAANPNEAIEATLPGKLPQSRIATESAAGYSSYGNQIGLATGKVVEYYHEGYKAKHMELGAVVGAVPLAQVKRLEPQAGDLILLIGGATGRDGCGGATGSSKSQNNQSLDVCAAEVQKGNAPEEHKLQRLFLNPEFSRRVKRCNDFGAGGVSVAVGELADSLRIDLDALPVKYEGLSGTELAISESQERMAVVIDAADETLMKALAAAENLSASTIAQVTDDRQLRMFWQGEEIVSLSRDFLDTNGAPSQQNQVRVDDVDVDALKRFPSDQNWRETFKARLQNLKYADQRGLGDRFDHSVGASCVLLPYGGRTQRSPSEASAYLLPTAKPSKSASILAHGFNPDIAAQSPFHGGFLAVIEATTRLVAAGGEVARTHYSLQEYFRRLKSASDWGQPVAALLGAVRALSALNRAAIGGKDSMSGSFNDLHVPPTLVAFAVTHVMADEVFSPEFKQAGDKLYLLHCPQDALALPDMAVMQAHHAYLKQQRHALNSIRAIRHGGLLQALYECCLGNDLGVQVKAENLFAEDYGSYLISSREALPECAHLHYLGEVTADAQLKINGESIATEALYALASGVLDGVYPMHPERESRQMETVALAHQDKKETLRASDKKEGSQSAFLFREKPQRDEPPKVFDAKEDSRNAITVRQKAAQPRVCLPVFPGTNSELDTARAFERAGHLAQQLVICNRQQQDLEASLKAWAEALQHSQILALSGGFSAGDEPDGSGKFIANLLSSPRIRDAIHEFLERDGLIIGICNGFQALVKSGLLPDGRIHKPQAGAATLAHNDSMRHISRVVTTVVANNHSPWLAEYTVGELHNVECSHGEGRFIASEEVLKRLLAQGQIAFQYANPQTGQPSMDVLHNPNGSMWAIEGITSSCGRILGKMGHSERQKAGTHRNFPDFRRQDALFAAAAKAFR